MLEQPVKIPLSGRTIATCILFSVFALFFIYGAFLLITQDIYMEDDTLMPIGFKVLFMTVLCIVELGILNMVIPLWHRILSGRGAMTLTRDGISDTFFIFTILAFWTTMKVRIIPWDAIEYNAEEKTFSVDIKKLPKKSCNILARFILLGGFNYQVGKITGEELYKYKQIADEMNYVL